MFTTHLADRPVRLFATPSFVLAHACSPDRNQAGIGADQALGTEPCRLECLPHLQAIVHVEAEAVHQRLVEANVSHRPRRQHHEPAVHDVHLAGAALGSCPREAVQLPLAVLVVVVPDRAGANLSAPPGQAASSGRANAPGHGHFRIGHELPHLGAELGGTRHHVRVQVLGLADLVDVEEHRARQVAGLVFGAGIAAC